MVELLEEAIINGSYLSFIRKIENLILDLGTSNYPSLEENSKWVGCNCKEQSVPENNIQQNDEKENAFLLMQ